MFDQKAFTKAFSVARVDLLSREEMVFFTTICMGLNHVVDTSIDTACTDGLKVSYNPEFFMGLDKDERPTLIAHESLHVVLEHCNERAAGANPELWNKAADYVANLILVKAGMKLPKGGLINHDYENLSTLQVYRLLEESEGKGNGSGGGNTMGGVPLNDIIPTPGDKKEEVKKQVEELVMRAKVMAEMAGKMPGSLGGDLDRLMNRMLKPAIPWQRLLQRFLNSVTKSDFSWKRPNRRYMPDLYMPTLRSPGLGRIDFGVDTSGSVQEFMFDAFMSEIYHVVKRFKPDCVGVLQFDWILQGKDVVTNIKDLKKLKLRGGGGTNVAPVLTEFCKNNSQALFVLTDGYFHKESLENPKKPVIWLIYDNPGFTAPFGQVVHFKLEELVRS